MLFIYSMVVTNFEPRRLLGMSTGFFRQFDWTRVDNQLSVFTPQQWVIMAVAVLLTVILLSLSPSLVTGLLPATIGLVYFVGSLSNTCAALKGKQQEEQYWSVPLELYKLVVPKPTASQRAIISIVDTSISLTSIIVTSTNWKTWLPASNLALKSLPSINQVLRNFILEQVKSLSLPITKTSMAFEMKSHISTLVGLFFALPMLFGVEGNAVQFLKAFRSYRKQNLVSADVLTSIQSALKWILDLGGYFLLGREIPLEDPEIREWYENATQILDNHFDFVEKMSTVDDRSTYLAGLDALIKDLLSTCHVFDSLDTNSHVYALLSKKKTDLQGLSIKVSKQLRGLTWRAAPFAVCIYGPPSTGKSWLADQVFNQYAFTHNKPLSPGNIYTYGDNDKYMSGYRSSMWGILLDDVGALHAKNAPDSKCESIINIVNNTIYNSPQADIDDKAAHPVLSECVIATSNTLTFAEKSYRTPYAVYRRFRYYITQIISPEYLDESGKIDSSLLMGNEKKACTYKVSIAISREGLKDPIDQPSFKDVVDDFVVPNKSHQFASVQTMSGFKDLLSPSGNNVFTLTELMTLIKDESISWVREQEMLLAARGFPFVCTQCGLISVGCSCVSPSLSNSTAVHVDEKWKSEFCDAIVPYEPLMLATHTDSRDFLGKHKKELLTAGLLAIPVSKIAYDWYFSREDAPIAEPSKPDFWAKAAPIVFSHQQKSTSPGVFDKLVSSNLVQLRAFDGSNHLVEECHALHLGNGYFLTVGHILSHLKFSVGHVFTSVHTENFTFPSKCETFVHPDLDLGIVLVKNYVPSSSGLLVHMLEQKNPTGNLTVHSYSSISPNVSTKELYQFSTGYSHAFIAGQGDKLVTVGEIPGAVYQAGSCGSPIIAYGNTGQAVCGVLCAAVPQFNCSQFAPLDFAWISKVVTPSLPITEIFKPKDVQPFAEHASVTYTSGFHQPVYTVGNKVSPKTKCKESLLFDAAASLGLKPNAWSAPSFKTPVCEVKGQKVYVKERSPLHNNLVHIKGPKTDYDQSIMTLAFDDLFRTLRPMFHSTNKLSLHESINGNDVLEGIDMTTSAGFPYTGPKSDRMIQIDDGTWDLTAEDKKLFFEAELLIDSGHLVRPVFTGTFKDEVVTEQKQYEGKIRLFAACPYLYTILVRRYYGDFIAQFKKCAFPMRKGEHVYGINHNSLDWDLIGKEFAKRPNNIVCGDFSKFDKVLSAEMIQLVFDMIHKLTGHDNEVGYDVMSYDMSHIRMLIKGDVVDLPGTNPSGGPLTTIINCIANMLLHRYAWFELCSKQGVIRPFAKNVFLLTYGDDSMYSTDEVEFNQLWMERSMKSINVKYTAADKSKVSKPFISLDEADLLSRSFSKQVLEFDGEKIVRYVAPLKFESIIRMLSWRSPATSQPEEFWLCDVLRSARLEIAKYEHIGHPQLASVKELYQTGLDYLVANNVLVNDLDLLSGRRLEHYLATGDILPVLQPISSKKEVAFNGDDGIVVDEAIVTFDDNMQSEEYVEDIPMPTLGLYNKADAGLGSFPDRPVIAATATWTDGTAFNQSFDLWNLWLTNAAVADKVSFFYGIRGTMCVRILTNGAPTKVGAIAVGYIPIGTPWTSFQQTTVSGSEEHLCRVVQLPGPNFAIDVSTNPPCEFEIPFISAQDYINLKEFAAGTDLASPRNHLFLSSYGTLEDSGVAGLTNVGITIYVWLKDWELVVPRPIARKVSKYEAQGYDDEEIMDSEEEAEYNKVQAQKKKNSSKKKKSKGPDMSMKGVATAVKSKTVSTVMSHEGNTNGPLSSISSAFANASGALSEVPGIGHYAKMAATGFNYATKAFSFFGYSRPTVDPEVAYFREEPFGVLANTMARDNSMPLTVDPKYGLAIEPSLRGLPDHDSLNLAGIASRWGYLGSFDWFGTDAASTRIVDVGVIPTPVISAGGPPTQFVMTPVAMATWGFDYHRMDLEYMFLILSSKFVSGRACISYDPSGTTHAALPSNTQYNTLVDINAGIGMTKACVRVPYSQPVRYLKTLRTNNNNFAAQAGIIYNSESMNGSLRFSVINPLAASSDAYARVVVFVRAGENFDVAAPSYSAVRTLTPISKHIEPQGFDDVEVIDLGPPPDLSGAQSQNLVYFGEKITSARALMKRYQYWTGLQDAGSSVDYGRVQITLPHRPFPGWVDVAFNPAAFSNTPYGTATGWACATTYQAFWRPAFQGELGSQRWKVCVSNGAAFNQITAMRSKISTTNALPNPPIVETQLTRDAQGTVYLPAVPIDGDFQGYHSVPFQTQPVVCYTVPYYNRLKFSMTSGFMYNNNVGPFPPDDYFRMYSHVYCETFSGRANKFDIHTAVGEDYDLFMFLCSPLFFEKTTLP